MECFWLQFSQAASTKASVFQSLIYKKIVALVRIFSSVFSKRFLSLKTYYYAQIVEYGYAVSPIANNVDFH